ncbi:hypothetical protein DTO013E5_6575 [Penicillium roqueforti]|uniref:uncharacterized protein n=1 Tax=Penicillium roqueforti TaxID=5082 RepID=UPI00190962BD|nr:uncharacterized protein LCP9604111_6761 [Penicillium roqueforti]KAF9246089.1 hypothetical protein LCP9604111_6761 [Penicillium roqueforti]KAI1834435.1 hypothetical protein CBS147337_4725 [Penicillium roqueforti]KAI2686039.1 hypothetical protein CBS147355_1526 [Penicillium roqueforti]KAI2692257.1 hypothetical protein LCP963914a_351 [Penicillium roqueforti]KAI2705227.1 hypothetical protein CBS147372_1530 [Penicillium roqueforti]
MEVVATVISITRALVFVINIFDECRQLIVTKELGYLRDMADGLRTTLSRTKNPAELILRHTDPSSVSANGYRVLCEGLQKKLINFKKTAKIINDKLQSICGKTGSTFSKNHKGLVKLIRLQANTRLFRRLQDRVSSHASSIGSLLLAMDTYYQKGFQEKLDIKIDRLLLLQEKSRLPNELGTQQVGTATSLPNKSKPFTIPRLATDFYREWND